MRSHLDQSEILIQCATYLQPNGTLGGGLTVIPGNQGDEDQFLDLYEKQILAKIRNKLRTTLGISIFDQISKSGKEVVVQNEIGDLLIG